LEAESSDTTSELRAREADFNQALLRSDWRALGQIEADDLIFTNADGSVTHKSDEVANLRSGNLKFASIDMSDITVKDLENVGVVTGQLVERVQYKTTDISSAYRFTDVGTKETENGSLSRARKHSSRLQDDTLVARMIGGGT